ncbi:protoporphyrinogen oxidase HemJ [Sulfuricurvum sp. IAE1]|jgi:putative membrane protein|uniref:protoporphyrinogen oxidase HemJ n=1 Tax=Sulfuricurvum sp. IAE1 TaxID=2546102 RepID=UPI00105264E1|nr:protoporphyrinogen oxidase HemJ [Sulfuricurvum sp. IAE1]MDD3769116.1 protoporphyrinogen oxidase HemJ [Sulfuricurvum sp.]MDX9966956.1 protoporphyrinogen oxidase HemJ [Sulfuricurvum sp.]TDA69607.1 protoporphyrinogen oxidase HemJ [Sulfuricurvum sp. IAE1]
MYNWVLWFHIISMVSWFAVLFYLPRLFVYHAENGTNNGFVEVVEVMEMKIYRYIGVPAFWATFLSGIALIAMSTSQYGVNVFGMGGWMHAKAVLVVLLIAYFFSLGRMRLRLKENTAYKSGKFFRMYNEVPTILLILIVALVIVKPF